MKKKMILILMFLVTVSLTGCSLLSTSSVINTETEATSASATTRKPLITADPNQTEEETTTVASTTTTAQYTTDAITQTTIVPTTINTTIQPTTEEETTSYRTTSSSGTTYTTTVKSDSIDYSEVYFFSFNDTHGQLVETSNMGMSQVAGIIDYLEDEASQSYIKIANGDIFQGTYVSRMTYGRCFIDCMNEMGFDMMTLGNHEFDWTLDKIYTYWDGDTSNGEANFPLVCCNVVDTTTNKRPSWIDPYTIVQYGDVKVGIIGAIGADQESDISTTTIGTYQFNEIEPYIEQYTVELRNEGCDVVCLAVHDYDESLYSTYASLDSKYRLDAIFFGHTHQSVDGYYTRTDGYEIPYVQCYTKNGNVGSITLTLDSNNVPKSGSIAHYNMSYFSTYVKKEDAAVAKIIKDKYQSIVDDGNEVIYTSSSILNSKKKVANFFCDLMCQKYGCDVAYVNTGGVRTYLSSTTIMTSDVFEIFPFDNCIVTCEMTGQMLDEYLNYNRGLYYNSDFSTSSIDVTKTYKVVTIDYVALNNSSIMAQYCVNGNFTVLTDIMRDSMVDYLKSLK